MGLGNEDVLLCLPAALFSYFPSGLTPDSRHPSKHFLALEQKYSPSAKGDAETNFGCLMTDGYWYLLCRITRNTGQSRKSKETAN